MAPKLKGMFNRRVSARNSLRMKLFSPPRARMVPISEVRSTMLMIRVFMKMKATIKKINPVARMMKACRPELIRAKKPEASSQRAALTPRPAAEMSRITRSTLRWSARRTAIMV